MQVQRVRQHRPITPRVRPSERPAVRPTDRPSARPTHCSTDSQSLRSAIRPTVCPPARSRNAGRQGSRRGEVVKRGPCLDDRSSDGPLDEPIRVRKNKVVLNQTPFGGLPRATFHVEVPLRGRNWASKGAQLDVDNLRVEVPVALGGPPWGGLVLDRRYMCDRIGPSSAPPWEDGAALGEAS